MENLNRADIKFFIFLTLFMVDQFSIVICYWKILVSYQQNFTMVFPYLRGLVLTINSMIFLGVKSWRECEASEHVTLHVRVLRNYQV